MNSFCFHLPEAPYGNYGNIYEEANNGGGFNNAAMHQHVESYYQIPTAARFSTFLAPFFSLLLVDVTLNFKFPPPRFAALKFLMCHYPPLILNKC